jgi:hypothetical protein
MYKRVPPPLFAHALVCCAFPHPAMWAPHTGGKCSETDVSCVWPHLSHNKAQKGLPWQQTHFRVETSSVQEKNGPGI